MFLNPAKWYKWDEVKQHLPSKNLTENSIQAGISRDFADFNYAYKIKFFEVVHPNQDPPLSFLKIRQHKQFYINAKLNC